MTAALSRLPFEEVWVLDTEFYPGRGLANGGREGDAPTPLCLVALELRSGRVIRLWQDELGTSPPYRLDAGALIVGYMVSADLGTHIALGWPQPTCALDPYIEFRHHTNDGSIKGGDREKGFYSLDGALRFFHVDGVDTARKTDMRDRIVRGPPFTNQERSDILGYCEDDVRNLARLLPFLLPTIASIPHALGRAAFMWAVAHQERRGVPLGDGQLLERLRARWGAMQTDLVIEMDRPFGVYEIVDGVPHWRSHRFADYLRRNGMSWPAYADGSLDEREATFREMEGKYPRIGPLRELRCSLSQLRLNALAVGNDGRNRTLLGPYGSKTGRNQPSNSKYIFGPAKWIRFLIEPAPAYALVHRDFTQQEPKVAAVLSGDPELLDACTGDVYLGIAKQLGFIRESMSPAELEGVRAMFKTVVLGIQYGLGASSLAVRTGVSLSEAYEILARLRARFRVFEAYAQNVIDHAGLHLEIGTPFGWHMRCPSGMNKRTIRNFPIQSTGAEILHVVGILAERRGIRIVAPIHDAFVVECKAGEEGEASAALDRVMRDASRIVLRGYELNSDEQVVRAGGRFFDKRGVEMWSTVNRLLVKLEGGAGERRAV